MLEAFSDGVIAIILTILVLELKIPVGGAWENLKPLSHVFLCYLLSFIYIGIYWNNHHHMLHATSRVNGRILWANLHLLFWLSLVPFTTAWMGENHFAPAPVALYGVNLTLAAIAYYILAHSLVGLHGKESNLGKALGTDFKGKASVWIYVAALAASFRMPAISCALYVLVAVIWVIPDRRIENSLHS